MLQKNLEVKGLNFLLQKNTEQLINDGDGRVKFVRFDDGLERRIDFSPILAGTLFGPLRDAAVFNQVRVDPEVHTVVWPNGADFDPATLHDWPDQEAAFRELAQRWELATH